MKKIIWLVILAFYLTNCDAIVPQKVTIVNPHLNQQRVLFGVESLKASLQKLGYQVSIKSNDNSRAGIFKIVIGEKFNNSLKKEGYTIKSTKNAITISGADASGILYGCLELGDQSIEKRQLPSEIQLQDAPEMVLRGECIGLQKPYYLTGRTVYEYPYTPQTFPWLYNKKLWLQVLDSMVHNRMNSLYLWNGHPFASLVKLKDYPYAVEVDDATFAQNEEIFKFLTTEADKRGIWVIQMFYNIIVSKPFAEKNGIKTQERERPIIPIISDYTRKSIAAFVAKYPNVGLMVCLGEAMEGTGQDDIDWFTKTIIPGVKDGLTAIGKTDEPPIVLRAHDTDAPAVMRAALPLYKNLYTEAKFNGEALTYDRPRGAWADLHQTLSKLGSVQIENIHILANLEPFRYGATHFIQQSVIGMHEVMGGNGLHLYPQASYWDWPYTADSVANGERLLQIERDWLWYKAWSRYAWKSKRSPDDELKYWAQSLASQFGVTEQDGSQILQAYEELGQISPKLLRRFGITDGNRQTLNLGMLMTQLINPYRFGLFTLLYESESPEGESLAEYADKEWNNQQHHGETPINVISDVKRHGDMAVTALQSVQKVTKNDAEFKRIKNDAYAYRAMAYHYALKAEAALNVLRYKYSNNIADLEKALGLLKESVKWYNELVTLTNSTYLYANSMQTGARKIPLSGSGGQYKKWYQILPVFEKEVSTFQHKIDSLKQVGPGNTAVRVNALQNADIKLINDNNISYYIIDSLAQPFVDKSNSIKSLAPELKGLKGVRMSFNQQMQTGTQISFSNKKPVKVLVGYFKPQKAAFSVDTTYLKQPELETNASANDYGQAETKIANALVISDMPQLHVHSYEFKSGNNTLKLGKGAVMILGFINAETPLRVYDAGLYESGNQKQVDWLFE